MQHGVITPYTLQYNGLVERKYITILNMAICMVNKRGMTKSFWGETINIPPYVLNKCPTRRLKNKVHVRV